MKIRISIWNMLCLAGLTIHQLIDEYIRPAFGKGQGEISFLLGISPNFIAAGLIFPFAGLTLWEYYKPPGHTAHRHRMKQWFFASLIVSQAGLILWEFAQRYGRLVFDWYDIAATLAGGVFAVLIYFSGNPDTM
jgi:hypothetical protein